MFYLQDSRSYVGNSPLWWAKGSGGYTCDLDKAELFTEEEAMKLFEDRSTDIPWKKEDVENAVKRLVDAQYLKKSDEDGFYSKLTKRQEEKRVIAEQEHAAYCLKEYKNNELFSIAEHIDLSNVSDEIDFVMAFEESKKKLDWHEHYYPTAYLKEDEEIFQDLITHDFIFKCEECNRYFHSIKRDDEYMSLCDDCGAEKWDKEHEDEGE